MRPKILIASSSFTNFPVVPQKTWKKFLKDYRVILNPLKRRLTEKELIKYGKGCVGIIAGLEPYTENVFKKLPSLRCISRDGAGMENALPEIAPKYNIVINNTPTAPTQAVTELTIALIINLLRNIPYIHNDIKKKKWNKYHGRLLQGRTVGIIGVGHIGKRVAILAKAFGCHVLGNDLNPDHSWFRQNNIKHTNKKSLFSKSDIICLHPSFLPQNYHLISNKEIKMMKKGVLLFNLSRGPIVDEKALLTYLKNGHLGGAALDVFEQEPYQGELTKFDNVILTPHIGGSTQESRYHMQMGALQNLLNTLNTT